AGAEPVDPAAVAARDDRHPPRRDVHDLDPRCAALILLDDGARAIGRQRGVEELRSGRSLDERRHRALAVDADQRAGPGGDDEQAAVAPDVPPAGADRGGDAELAPAGDVERPDLEAVLGLEAGEDAPAVRRQADVRRPTEVLREREVDARPARARL